MAISAAIAGAAYGIRTGEKQRQQQKRALSRQEEAQRNAEARAQSEQRRADMEFRAANREKPDIGSLLTSELAAEQSGAGATLLTGPGGVDPKRLKLGRTSLLGG